MESALDKIVSLRNAYKQLGFNKLKELNPAHPFVVMFERVPSLKALDLDYDKALDAFEVLVRYAPALADDPFVAGGFVKGVVMMGMVDPATVKMLADAQGSIDQNHDRFISTYEMGVLRKRIVKLENMVAEGGRAELAQEKREKNLGPGLACIASSL